MSSKLDKIANWESRIARANFRVDALARNCGVSERDLRNFIEARTGMSPHLWCLNLRLKPARAFLGEGLSVKETAAKLGFKQQGHFSRVFKLVYGIYPAAFARSQRKLPI